jgi:hypothetical protein
LANEAWVRRGGDHSCGVALVCALLCALCDACAMLFCYLCGCTYLTYGLHREWLIKPVPCWLDCSAYRCCLLRGFPRSMCNWFGWSGSIRLALQRVDIPLSGGLRPRVLARALQSRISRQPIPRGTFSLPNDDLAWATLELVVMVHLIGHSCVSAVHYRSKLPTGIECRCAGTILYERTGQTVLRLIQHTDPDIGLGFGFEWQRAYN